MKIALPSRRDWKEVFWNAFVLLLVVLGLAIVTGVAAAADSLPTTNYAKIVAAMQTTSGIVPSSFMTLPDTPQSYTYAVLPPADVEQYTYVVAVYSFRHRELLWDSTFTIPKGTTKIVTGTVQFTLPVKAAKDTTYHLALQQWVNDEHSYCAAHGYPCEVGKIIDEVDISTGSPSAGTLAYNTWLKARIACTGAAWTS